MIHHGIQEKLEKFTTLGKLSQRMYLAGRLDCKLIAHVYPEALVLQR